MSSIAQTLKVAYFEEVKERIGEHIIASTIRLATKQEIETASQLHKDGKCPHNVIIDEKAWLYDYRSCFTCGKGLGAI